MIDDVDKIYDCTTPKPNEHYTRCKKQGMDVNVIQNPCNDCANFKYTDIYNVTDNESPLDT